MNNEEYLDEVQEEAIEIMTDSTESSEDRFAAMIVAMLAQTYNKHKILQ